MKIDDDGTGVPGCSLGRVLHGLVFSHEYVAWIKTYGNKDTDDHCTIVRLYDGLIDRLSSHTKVLPLPDATLTLCPKQEKP